MRQTCVNRARMLIPYRSAVETVDPADAASQKPPKPGTTTCDWLFRQLSMLAVAWRSDDSLPRVFDSRGLDQG